MKIPIVQELLTENNKLKNKLSELQSVSSDKTNISLIELLINLTIISAGKTKLIKHLMWFRSLENEPISTKDWNRKISKIFR